MKTYMTRALELAQKGAPNVHPNPMVGALIVKNGTIIAEGYHQQFGGPHAEVNCFAQTKEPLEDTTMYVTLEPCSHYGKTPPCADAIIASGIKEVHVASLDPNPLVSGRGIEKLRQAGITVHVGEENDAQWALNKVFQTYITKKRPYITLKTAMSADGKIATISGESQWITNPSSRKSVHHTRAQARAVLIGKTTALKDDPELTVRLEHYQGKQPTRVVLDTHAQLPLTLKLFQTAHAISTILVVSEDIQDTTLEPFEALGVKILKAPTNSKGLNLEAVMGELAKLGLDHVMVEAGSTLAWSFFEADLVDEYHLYIGPKVLGGVAAITAVGGDGFASLDHARKFQLERIERFQDDVFIVYRKGER